MTCVGRGGRKRYRSTPLDLLRPTLRKEGSELWFSWNPEFKTDPVDAFFRKSPPEDAISVLVNWRDNPRFPDVLRREMEHDFAVDEDKALITYGMAPTAVARVRFWRSG